MARLTKRAIDALQPRAKPYVAFDGHVKGFGCRVMPSGVKSYILEYRPGAGGRGIAKKRLIFGKHGTMTAEQARKAALDALARIRLGRGPARREKPPAGFPDGLWSYRRVYRGTRQQEVQAWDGVWLQDCAQTAARRAWIP
jgi:hypothetical protein